MPGYTRRRFLSVAAGGVGLGAAGAFALSRRGVPAPPTPVESADAVAAAPDALRTVPGGSSAIKEPTPPPTPPAIRSRGREDVVLMTGTEWEATGTIFHSGLLGPRFVILGGVHGNEPGGWMGAESAAEWEVRRGSLIVLPRLNWRSAAAFERTLEGFGDLNRLYPGHPEGLPMARMAAEIVELVRAWQPQWLWDMHESWGFFAERGQNGGTAFIGQTVTSADAGSAAVIQDLVRRVNGQITEREQFLTRMRPGGRFGNNGQGGSGFATGAPDDDDDPDRMLPGGVRGSSSLSLGRFVPGVRPVLVEMGQMDQAEARRSELHQLLVRQMLTDLRML